MDELANMSRHSFCYFSKLGECLGLFIKEKEDGNILIQVILIRRSFTVINQLNSGCFEVLNITICRKIRGLISLSLSLSLSLLVLKLCI